MSLHHQILNRATHHTGQKRKHRSDGTGKKFKDIAIAVSFSHLALEGESNAMVTVGSSFFGRVHGLGFPSNAECIYSWMEMFRFSAKNFVRVNEGIVNERMRIFDFSCRGWRTVGFLLCWWRCSFHYALQPACKQSLFDIAVAPNLAFGISLLLFSKLARVGWIIGTVFTSHLFLPMIVKGDPLIVPASELKWYDHNLKCSNKTDPLFWCHLL